MYEVQVNKSSFNKRHWAAISEHYQPQTLWLLYEAILKKTCYTNQSVDYHILSCDLKTTCSLTKIYCCLSQIKTVNLTLTASYPKNVNDWNTYNEVEKITGSSKTHYVDYIQYTKVFYLEWTNLYSLWIVRNWNFTQDQTDKMAHKTYILVLYNRYHTFHWRW